MTENLFLLCLYLILTVDFTHCIQVTIESNVEVTGSQMTTLTGKEFYAFRGIPYAEPPVGELRFKPPVQKKWTVNTFNATEDGKACIQINYFTNTTIGEEDCLILNVYTHQVSTPFKKVMVFIHGGGFNSGTSLSREYGPKRIMDRDVVLVTFNYRLGALGFLSTFDESSPGNYGLLDQTEVLKWIQRNIAAFGGDRSKVTIFGESAGAASVMSHYISPVSKGLFHRAISQSGNLLCPWAENKNPLHWAKYVASRVGCDDSDSRKLVECLRKIPVEDIIKESPSHDVILIAFGPTKDGYFFSEFPSTLIEKGLISNRVPLMIGVTKDEGITTLGYLGKYTKKLSNELLTRLAAVTLNIEREIVPGEVVKLLNKIYFRTDDMTNETKLTISLSHVMTDGSFHSCHFQCVDILTKHDLTPFVYSYDYYRGDSLCKLLEIGVIEGVVGHGEDLEFLFDSEEFFPTEVNTPNNDVENVFLDVWVNFAENGYPSVNTLTGKVDFKSSTRGEILVHHLNNVIMADKYDIASDWRLEFWGRKIPKILRKSKKQPKDEL